MDVAAYILGDTNEVMVPLVALLLVVIIGLVAAILATLIDIQNKKFRARVQAHVTTMQESQSSSRVYVLDELILSTRQDERRFQIRWTWNHGFAEDLPLCKSWLGLNLTREMELIGYRKKGGGFAPDPLSDCENGEQIVHSRQDEDLEEAVEGATECFYTFVVRDVLSPEQKCNPKKRLVARFKVAWPISRSFTKDRTDTKRERRRRTIEEAVRAVSDIAEIKSWRRRLIDEAQRSSEFIGSTPEEQRQWLDDIDAIIEETRIKLSNLRD